MKKKSYFLSLIFLFFIGISCKKKNNLYLGEIQISIDRSLQSIIKEQLNVFKAQHKKAKIIAHYKSENECIKDVFNEKISLVILARELKEKEKKTFSSFFSFTPTFIKIAFEPIFIFGHIKNKKKDFTFKKLLSILETPNSHFNIVVEKNSSIINYLIELTREKKISPYLKNAKDIKSFFHYIASNENTIGFIGLDSFDFQDPLYLNAYLNKIEMLWLDSTSFKKPPYAFKKTIEEKYNHLLFRPISLILKENYIGLAKGISLFLQNKGQLIFKKAGFIPVQKNYITQEIYLN